MTGNEAPSKRQFLPEPRVTSGFVLATDVVDPSFGPEPAADLTVRWNGRVMHFVMTTGTLVKTLTRSAPLFPAIQPTYDAAAQPKIMSVILGR
jgi:hypothetical protein